MFHYCQCLEHALDLLFVLCPATQHAGGTSFIGSVVDALLPSPDCPMVLLDLFAFDAWPASHVLAQYALGQAGNSPLSLMGLPGSFLSVLFCNMSIFLSNKDQYKLHNTKKARFCFE